MVFEIKRGDIFYVSRTPVVGHEQFSGRPAIIVSNDEDNKYSGTVEVVYLTTQAKPDVPTHVTIQSAKYQSTALCEQVTTVSTTRLGDCFGSCTRDEMLKIDIAIMISLGLRSVNAYSKQVPENSAMPESSDQNCKGAIARLEAERDTYRTMYESLLSKVIRAG